MYKAEHHIDDSIVTVSYKSPKFLFSISCFSAMTLRGPNQKHFSKRKKEKKNA